MECWRKYTIHDFPNFQKSFGIPCMIKTAMKLVTPMRAGDRPKFKFMHMNQEES